MAVKFIDQNRKKEYSDEVLLRCMCGCGLVSFKIIEATEEEEEKSVPIVEVMYYGSSDNDRHKDFYKANYMLFADSMSIQALFRVIDGSIPDGVGAIQSDTGPVLEVRRGKSPEDGEEGMMLLGFTNAKYFKKFALSGGKKLKNLAWNLHLNNKELNLFVEAMKKLYTKYFKAVLPDLLGEINSNEKVGK